jgi:hypothetical protein
MMIDSAIIFMPLPILVVAHRIDCVRRGKAYGSR